MTVSGKEPGEVKAAFVPEPDVDEDDVRSQRAGFPESLCDAGGNAHDGDALSLEQNPRRLKERIVVVNEQAPQRHTTIVAGRRRRRIAASSNRAAAREIPGQSAS